MRTEPILPGSTIGVLGGGQLGRMLAMEARRMGYRVVVLDPDPRGPAGLVADDVVAAPLDDADAARELARRSDVITLEWENANVEVVRELEKEVPVRPGAHVLEVAQHRVREKDTARRLGLDTAPYRAVRSEAELESALDALGVPAVLKTARGGYDGKGQALIRDRADAGEAFRSLAGPDPDLILEGWVPFRAEASVICARSPDGEIRSFPIGENSHRNGILDTTLVPARLPDSVLAEARRVGETFTEGLDVVGLLAVELFITGDDRVLVNEIAPRPHNSGHYTWEATAVSQFEQQLRAVCGLPLGDPGLLRPAAMVNLLGEEIGTGLHESSVIAALKEPSVALHLYGKQEGRTGRKMGHFTALGASVEEALERALRAKQRITQR